MGVSNLVASASGLTSAVKSVQSGSASTAGTVTITSVNTSKCIISSFSTGATGTVSVSGGFNGENVGLNAISSTLAGTNPWNFGTTGSYNSWDIIGGASVNSGNVYQLMNTFSSVYAGTNTYPYTGLNQNISSNAANGSTSGGNLNGGSTNLYAASYGAYLTNATTLTVTGPCQWQVVEYN